MMRSGWIRSIETIQKNIEFLLKWDIRYDMMNMPKGFCPFPSWMEIHIKERYGGVLASKTTITGGSTR